MTAPRPAPAPATPESRRAARDTLLRLRANLTGPEREQISQASRCSRLVVDFLVATIDLDGPAGRALLDCSAFNQRLDACLPLVGPLGTAVLAATAHPGPDLDDCARTEARRLHGLHRAVRSEFREAVDRMGLAPAEAARARAVGDLHEDEIDALMLIDAERSVAGSARVAELADEAARSADEAREAARTATEASTAAAEDSLSGHFREHADSERRRANAFLLAGAGLLVCTTGLLLVLTAVLGAVTPTTVLVKLAAALPLAALAAHLVRESVRHRADARAATLLAVRLHVLPAYRDLDAESRRELRSAFARQVFLDPPPLGGDGPPAPPGAPAGPGDDVATADPLAQVLALAERLVDLIRGRPSGAE